MFVDSEAEAAAIRTAFDRGGELSAAIELRRLSPGATDMAEARECARTIAGWKPLPVRPRQWTRREIPGGLDKAAAFMPGRPPAGMFVVTEADASAIRAAFDRGGELSAAVELRRLDEHFDVGGFPGRGGMLPPMYARRQ
jgi:hypothetical protein